MCLFFPTESLRKFSLKFFVVISNFSSSIISLLILIAFPLINLLISLFDFSNFEITTKSIIFILSCKEDLSRSKTYLSNSKRKNLKKKFDNIDDYMKSLQMSAECSSFKRKNYDRVVQLFQRSNQFNFTTIRYSLGDIQKFEKNKSNITMQVSFNDKFSEIS